MIKTDIADHNDIILMVNKFYTKVRESKILGYIFNDVVQVDWENHLPKMYSFWSSLLLGEQSYTGNPMVKHIELSKIAPMTETQFSDWLLLFTQTVDELFEGEKANEAKMRAANIAGLMLHKVQSA